MTKPAQRRRARQRANASYSSLLTLPAAAPSLSFDRERVHRRARPADDLERRSYEEEVVLTVLGTIVGKVLQIADLVEWDAEVAEQRAVKWNEDVAHRR